MSHNILPFTYCSRRAREEQVAAINARSAVAAAAHRKLSELHATQALIALLSASPSYGNVEGILRDNLHLTA
ncbi:hypothetical protein [Sphingomonas carotinifaciens]|uniref:Uncharacterized protein n=1 Tax=Sphingomonas carotinifaciens TaxID=1166323 RepID=A0A6N8LUP4_9SPHN|nr:hypothetical protein [Sphingomonas carotinifaciens]MBB4087260.1 hypothetical protein [Sphingomonas carotinifaciens]MWC44710.1 hypothetical protein [Sphingomonas carotinifaciens]